MKTIATLGSVFLLTITLSACSDDTEVPDTSPESVDTPGPNSDAPSPDAPSASATGSAPSNVTAGTQACGADPIEITTNDIDVRLTGDCADVTIRARDVEVDADSIESLTIEGNDNDVDVSGDLGSVTINGDDNEVDSRGTIDSVTINGNDNDIDAATVGHVTDNGRQNEINR